MDFLSIVQGQELISSPGDQAAFLWLQQGPGVVFSVQPSVVNDEFNAE